MSQLIQLPRDIWSNHVVQFLSMADIVQADNAACNRRDRDAFLSNLYNCSHTQEVTFNDNYEAMSQWLIQRKITASAISIRTALLTEEIPSIVELLSNANSLSFENGFQLYNEDLEVILQFCTQRLERLSIRHCPATRMKVLCTCPRLTSLRLQDCNDLTSEAFVRCMEGCPQLQNVAIVDCVHLSTHAFAAIPHAARNLTSLELRGDFSLDEVLSCFPPTTNMRALVVQGCTITSISFERIAHCMPQLEVFRLISPAQNLRANDIDLELLTRTCTNLKSIELSGCGGLTHSTMHNIGSYLPNLEELRVAHCSAVHEFSLVELAHCCPKLRLLDVSNNAGNVRDVDIIAVCTNCLQLTHLDVSFCSALSDHALSALGSLTLTFLDVSFTNMDGSFLAPVLNHQSSLTTLKCAGCRFKGHFLKDITTHCSLRHLDLQNTTFTHDDWMRLSVLFPRILSINAVFCKHVDAQVKAAFRENTTVKDFETVLRDEDGVEVEEEVYW